MNALLLSLLFLMQSTARVSTGAITGRLLSDAGLPISAVRVALSAAETSGELVGITQTDSEGRYRIESVSAGRYYIVAGLVDKPTYFPGVISPERATLITIDAGSLATAPDFRLLLSSGGLKVKGRVIREGIPQGVTPPPLAIRLTEARAGGNRGGSSERFLSSIAADGSFEMRIPPGRYSVFFSPNVFYPIDPITLDGDLDNLEYRIPASALHATIEGTSRVDGIGPLPPVGIRMTRADLPSSARPRIGSFFEGALSMPETPTGEYSIEVTGIPTGYFIKSFTAGSANLLTQNLKVTHADPPRLALVLGVTNSMPGVRVKGRITNQDDAVLPGSLTLSGVLPGLKLQAQLHGDGSFEFPTVTPGKYEVELSINLDATPVTRTITVGKEDPSLVEVPLRVAGMQRISVTMIDRPSTSLFPYLRAEGRPESQAIRGRMSVQRTWQFLNVAPGAYRIFLAPDTPAGLGYPVGSGISVVVVDKDLSVELHGR